MLAPQKKPLCQIHDRALNQKQEVTWGKGQVYKTDFMLLETLNMVHFCFLGSSRLFRGAGVIITIIIPTIITTTSMMWVKSRHGAQESGSAQHVRMFYRINVPTPHTRCVVFFKTGSDLVKQKKSHWSCFFFLHRFFHALSSWQYPHHSSFPRNIIPSSLSLMCLYQLP